MGCAFSPTPGKVKYILVNGNHHYACEMIPKLRIGASLYLAMLLIRDYGNDSTCGLKTLLEFRPLVAPSQNFGVACSYMTRSN